jgi:hypothetical protein
VSDSEARRALYLMGAAIAHLRRPMDPRRNEERTPVQPPLPLVGSCNLEDVGVNHTDHHNYGNHPLCRTTYRAPCSVLTYGVEHEYSFELELGRRGCTVLGLDPTVSHSSSLGNGVHFANFGAHSRMTESSLKRKYHVVTPAHAAHMVSETGQLDILKMDCEGCEHMLYNQTMRTNPHFFDSVDQFALESHISRRWIPNEATMLEYGRLLALLLRADFLLYDVVTSWCLNGEERGIISEMVSIGYFRRDHDHCENLLFAKARHHTPTWKPPYPYVGVHPPKSFPRSMMASHTHKDLMKLRVMKPDVSTADPPKPERFYTIPHRNRRTAIDTTTKPESGAATELEEGWMEIKHPSTSGVGLDRFYARQHGPGAAHSNALLPFLRLLHLTCA